MRSKSLVFPLTVGILLMVVTAFPLLPPARAATPGVTAGLVNPEQPTRDASSAIPVIGFGMTDAAGATLSSVTVDFSGAGFQSGNDRDLRLLDVDAELSGVGLYRDDGLTDDILDAGDTPLTLTDIGWTGNSVDLDLTGANEPLPTSVQGSYHWILVIRTAEDGDALNEGDQIVVTIPSNGIVASDATSQPASAVSTSSLFIRFTRGVDMVDDPWIGPARARLNTMAVLGFRLVDGGVDVNRGIDDRMTSVTVFVDELFGNLGAVDFQPFSTDATRSGLALYQDDGSTEDEWDTDDTPLNPAGINPSALPPGGGHVTLTFNPGIIVPDSISGTLEFFFVVRTEAISTWDIFNLEVGAGDVVVEGLLAGPVDGALLTPVDRFDTTLPSDWVWGDATPPNVWNEAWSEDSPYLVDAGLTLYFNNQMPGNETGMVTGTARDDESGLLDATFTQEPGLAASPPTMNFTARLGSQPWSGDYNFSASSVDTDSPIGVSIRDWVGNSISSEPFEYELVSEDVLIIPSPGWIQPSGPFWVDPSGVLWFGPMIGGTQFVSLQVDLISLFGGGLHNVTASSEPTLDGPTVEEVTYPGAPDSETFSTAYGFNSSSSDGADPVTITVTDESRNTAVASFAYREDSEAPVTTFQSPGTAALQGTITVSVDVTDVGSGVDSVSMAVDGTGSFTPMFWDGSSYFLLLDTAQYRDGSHRLLVRAEDRVGNQAVAPLEVFFYNAGSLAGLPKVEIVSPSPQARVAGVILFQVAVTEPMDLDKVRLSVFGRSLPMAFNVLTGLYEVAVDSRTVGDGGYNATVTATTLDGRTTQSSVLFDVRNRDYLGTVVFLAPLLIFAVLLIFLIFYLLRRLGRGEVDYGETYREEARPEGSAEDPARAVDSSPSNPAGTSPWMASPPANG